MRLPKSRLRRALLWGHINGGLWAAGNGLTSGALIIYFALDLGARGLALSLLLATPALVGLLRLVAPALVARYGGVKPVCLATLLASYLLLIGLPGIGWLEAEVALPALIGLLCAHQLLEYIGAVALWSWLGELVPRRVRGRYFGRRHIVQLAFLIPTLLASGYFADAWKARHADEPAEILAYALPHGVGVVLLLASLVPLVAMPSARLAPHRLSLAGLRLRQPLLEASFRRLLYFGCWLSFFNGVIQAAQNSYPKAVLGLGVLAISLLHSGMRLGQIGVSWWSGWFSDRFGNRPTLVASQSCVAIAPLFFLLATPDAPWWIVGAWVAWSFYAALNVCIPHLTLKLANGRDSTPYFALYYALTTLCYAGSTIVGGALFDWLETLGPWHIGGRTIDRYTLLFWFSWITRSLTVAWLLWLIEPGAWRWRDIVARFASSRFQQASRPVA